MNRQWRYPEEFQIVAPPHDPAVEADLEKLLAMLTEAARPAAAVPAAPPKPDEVHLLLKVSDFVWRIRHAMVPYGAPLLSSEPHEGARRALPSLERLWALLEENDIKIIDYTGKPYRSGMGVIPVFEPSSDVQEETVTDTMKPTIFHRNEIVQTGEVLVGIPMASES